jgi:hypothetical protein
LVSKGWLANRVNNLRSLKYFINNALMTRRVL